MGRRQCACTYSVVDQPDWYVVCVHSTSQGTMMGVLTGAGSGARTLGPIFVSNVYASYGPRIAFACVSGIVMSGVIFLLAVYKRLVPYEQSVLRRSDQN